MKKLLFGVLIATFMLGGCSSKPHEPKEVQKILEDNGYEMSIEEVQYLEGTDFLMVDDGTSRIHFSVKRDDGTIKAMGFKESMKKEPVYAVFINDPLNKDVNSDVAFQDESTCEIDAKTLKPIDEKYCKEKHINEAKNIIKLYDDTISEMDLTTEEIKEFGKMYYQENK